jgi:hypothetical protein
MREKMFCFYFLWNSFPELSYAIMQCGLDDAMASNVINRHNAMKYTHCRLLEADEIFARVSNLVKFLWYDLIWSDLIW